MVPVFQSIFTVNVEAFLADPSWQCTHALVLTTQGRVRLELFLVKPGRLPGSEALPHVELAKEELWAVVEAPDADDFRRVVRTYSFKRDLAWEDLSAQLRLTRFWLVPLMFWPSLDLRGRRLEGFLSGAQETNKAEGDPLDACFFDPREPSLGR